MAQHSSRRWPRAGREGDGGPQSSGVGWLSVQRALLLWEPWLAGWGKVQVEGSWSKERSNKQRRLGTRVDFALFHSTRGLTTAERGGARTRCAARRFHPLKRPLTFLPLTFKFRSLSLTLTVYCSSESRSPASFPIVRLKIMLVLSLQHVYASAGSFAPLSLSDADDDAAVGEPSHLARFGR